MAVFPPKLAQYIICFIQDHLRNNRLQNSATAIQVIVPFPRHNILHVNIYNRHLTKDFNPYDKYYYRGCYNHYKRISNKRRPYTIRKLLLMLIIVSIMNTYSRISRSPIVIIINIYRTRDTEIILTAAVIEMFQVADVDAGRIT